MAYQYDSRFVPDEEDEGLDPRFRPDVVPDPSQFEADPTFLEQASKAFETMRTIPKPVSRIAEKAFTTPEFVSKGYDKMRDVLGKMPPSIRANLPLAPLVDPGLDIAESLSTPGDVGLMLGTGGAGVVPRVGRMIQKGAGGLLALRGGERMATAESPLDVGVGALETAGGIFGARIPKFKPKVAPVAARPKVLLKVPQTPQERFFQALDEAKPLNEEQKSIYAAERAKRVARMEEIETPGIEGHRARKRELAGEYEKVDMTPLSDYLSPKDLDNLANNVRENAQLLPFEKIRATDALEKLYKGTVPQPNELGLLRKVFGGADEKLIKIAGKDKRGLLRRTATGTQDLMRAILTSYDFSAPGRQGKNLISRKEYWTAFPNMFKSWGSERLYRAGQEAILAHPNFVRPTARGKVIGKSLAERAELSITDLLTNREEIFRSRLAEKIPGIRMSERAYTGFLNKLRADRFNAMVDLAKKSGKDVDKNDVLLKQIGHFINDATGRGNLGPILEKHVDLMNATFFAPRLHAGKLRMWGRVFNPRFYTQTDPMVRKEVIRSLLASTSLGLLVGEVAKEAGATVSNDPTSSDFRKIKIGNTRVDPFGGDQQYAVAAAKLLTGQSTSSTTGKTTELWEGRYGQQTAGGVVADFMANRLAPIPSMAVNLLFNRSYGDEEFGIQSELMDKAVPIMVQDIYEVIEEDPSLAPLLVPAAFGVGVQTYGR